MSTYNRNNPRPTVESFEGEGKLRLVIAGHSMLAFLVDVAHSISNLPNRMRSGWSQFHHRFWLPHIMTFLTYISGASLVALVNDIVLQSHGPDNHRLLDQLP